MNSETLQEALGIYERLKVAKQKVKQLENEIAPFKDKIKESMGIAGQKLFECSDGYASWVDRKGSTKWNVDKLEEKLGDKVEEYRTIGAPSQFVKFGLYDKTNLE